MLPFFKLYVTSFYFLDLLHSPRQLLSTVIYYIHPANYSTETVYFVQLAVFCKAGLLQFRVAFK